MTTEQKKQGYSDQVKCYSRNKHGKLVSYWRRKEDVKVYDKTYKAQA